MTNTPPDQRDPLGRAYDRTWVDDHGVRWYARNAALGIVGDPTEWTYLGREGGVATMTITEAARILHPGREVNPTLINTTRRYLTRHGVKPLYRSAGRGGENVYDTAAVQSLAKGPRDAQRG